MGNVCSGFSSKDDKPQSVTLRAYNEIRIIPPTPSPGVITSSSLPDYAPSTNGQATIDGESVIVKPPQKLAPLAEPETLSPAPPPKKEVTGAVVIPDSPDSDTEKLITASADDLTQDGLGSEPLLEDAPATESPIAPTTTTMTKMTKTAAVVVNGGFVGDDVPLTDAEISRDDSSSPAVTDSPRVDAAASSEASEPANALPPPPPPSPSPPPPPTPPAPSLPAPIIVNGSQREAPNAAGATIAVGANGAVHSSQDQRSSSPQRAVISVFHGDVTKDAFTGAQDQIAADSLVSTCDETMTKTTTTTTTTTTTIIENGIEGIKPENIDVAIVDEDETHLPWASNVVDHNRNESQARATGRKDGHYFLEKTKNEENRIQTMCSSMEEHLSGGLSEEAEGKIRVFIGKATLLTSKKFKQFKGLCKQNLEQDEDETFKTTDGDLQGFWDLVMIQVEELDASYQDLLAAKSKNWIYPITTTESKSANSPSGARRKGAGVKKSTPTTPRSAEAEARSKAREEARRKLIAAKREAAKRLERASEKEDVFFESQENGVAHVNGDGGAAETNGDAETHVGLPRKKSLSFTIP